MEGQRTIGFSLSTGRGGRAASFVRRALRRRDLRPGCRLSVSDWFELIGGYMEGEDAQELTGRGGVLGRSGCGHDVANPCGNLGVVSMRFL